MWVYVLSDFLSTTVTIVAKRCIGQLVDVEPFTLLNCYGCGPPALSAMIVETYFLVLALTT